MDFTTLEASEWASRARELHGSGWLLLDLTAVDRLRLEPPEPRFLVVVQLLHERDRRRQSFHVIAEGEPPTVPSVTQLWPTADFFEREVFDLFGIEFDGHPNLTRILMPEEWEGHPLRKDYGVGKIPVEFIPQPLLQVGSPNQSPRSTEAGQQVDRLGQVIPQEGLE